LYWVLLAGFTRQVFNGYPLAAVQHHVKYESLPVPISDRWGVLMRQDSPLAKKKSIQPKDLIDAPLILSHQENSKSLLANWFGDELWSKVKIIATYNLAMNASILASEGVGYVLCFDKLFNVTGDSNLCFRPLKPKIQSDATLIWKKYQILGKAQQKFLERLQEKIAKEN